MGIQSYQGARCDPLFVSHKGLARVCTTGGFERLRSTENRLALGGACARQRRPDGSWRRLPGSRPLCSRWWRCRRRLETGILSVATERLRMISKALRRDTQKYDYSGVCYSHACQYEDYTALPYSILYHGVPRSLPRSHLRIILIMILMMIMIMILIVTICIYIHNIIDVIHAHNTSLALSLYIYSITYIYIYIYIYTHITRIGTHRCTY